MTAVRKGRGNPAQRRSPVLEDRGPDDLAAFAEPRSRRPPVLLVHGQCRESTALEPSQQAARRRQRTADPCRDLADPGAVIGLAQHEDRAPLRERELETGVSAREGQRRQADGTNHDPLEVAGECVGVGIVGMPAPR